LIIKTIDVLYLNKIKGVFETLEPLIYIARLDLPPLFLSNSGLPFTETQLSELVKKYLLKAGFDVNAACNVFRHSAATHMLENGAQLAPNSGVLRVCGFIDYSGLYPHHKY
jgi:site-specific recombinase XerD